MGGRRGGGAPALRPRARRRPALQHGDHAAGSLRRQDRADPRADQRYLRDLHRHRAPSAGTKPTTCPTCGGARQGAREPGLLHHRAHLPVLPGPRRDHQRPVRLLPRLGPRHQGAHALGQHPARRRGRHAHPPRRRRRGRPARRPGRRSLHLPVDQAARVLPARRRRHLLPRADLHDDGGARRPHRGADGRRRRRRA